MQAKRRVYQVKVGGIPRSQVKRQKIEGSAIAGRLSLTFTQNSRKTVCPLDILLNLKRMKV